MNSGGVSLTLITSPSDKSEIPDRIAQRTLSQFKPQFCCSAIHSAQFWIELNGSFGLSLLITIWYT